ncbi:NAD(P)-binding domain-containing protein [bacterium]|nr:NAD(P)-binding domain-containing protein [bacterium]
MKNIYIIGAGAFGTAIANQLAFDTGNSVCLICRSEGQAAEISQNHTNLRYFPNKMLHEALKATASVSALSNADIVFMALPTAALQENITVLKKEIPLKALVVNLSKGIFKNGRTLVDYLLEALDNRNVVTMKGPTFAVELINNEHSLFTLGYKTEDQYNLISNLIEKTNIQIDSTTDIKGVELLSALKNIYAIVIGIVDAQYNAINTRHMILTKAFSEIRVLLLALGGNEDTLFLGCGYGDFGLTALNDMSRNRTLGLLIGKGFYNSDVTKSSVVLEGLRTIDLISAATDEKTKTQIPLFNKLEYFFRNKESKFKVHFNSLFE